MTRPVVVIGGGLAGIQAALGCADAGLPVVLLERRARLGGATWSRTHRGLHVDNGQHVAMRCCTAYLALLERIGSRDALALQPRLEVAVARPGRPLAWIRRGRLPAPAHLGGSLLRFAPLSLAERLSAARAALAFRFLDPDDPALDAHSVGAWLEGQGQSDRVIDGLWDLLLRPTLNLPARDASLALAAKVLRTGFLDRADAADIGIPRVPFDALHAEPAERALAEAGVALRLRSRVHAIEEGPEGGLRVASAAGPLDAAAVVLATPHDAAGSLVPEAAGIDAEALAGLGHSPIVNLHVVFDRPVLDRPFLAALDSPVQWVFDRTAASGLAEGQYLTLSLSAGDAYLGASRERLAGIFLPALAALLPAAGKARCLDFFATNEPRATFRQAPGTRRLRPNTGTGVPGLFLAGAYTDTGWPDTMEGAVRSGVRAASAVRRFWLGAHGGRLPEAA